MNFSMQDTLNLGWKVAAVLRKQSPPALLRTYTEERQVVGKELIDFDRVWAKMISDKPKDGIKGASEVVDPKAFQRYFEQHGRFSAGEGTRCSPSSICGDTTQQHLATGFEVGKRFHSAPVVRITDAKLVHRGHMGKADGRWRQYAYAAAIDHHDAQAGLRALCKFLESSPDLPVVKYTRNDQDPDALFDLRTIFSTRQSRAGDRIHARFAAAAQRALQLARLRKSILSGS